MLLSSFHCLTMGSKDIVLPHFYHPTYQKRHDQSHPAHSKTQHDRLSESVCAFVLLQFNNGMLLLHATSFCQSQRALVLSPARPFISNAACITVVRSLFVMTDKPLFSEYGVPLGLRQRKGALPTVDFYDTNLRDQHPWTEPDSLDRCAH